MKDELYQTLEAFEQEHCQDGIHAVTICSPIEVKHLADCFAQACVEEWNSGATPTFYSKLFDPECDDCYVIYLFRRNGEWVGAACFRKTDYLGLYRAYLADGTPPEWCLQWAWIEPEWRNKGLFAAAFQAWEECMPKFLILDLASPVMDHITTKFCVQSERIIHSSGSDQLAWMPPSVRHASARYWGTYRRKH